MSDRLRRVRQIVWPMLAISLLWAGIDARAQENTQQAGESLSNNAPEITAITPRWGPSGWVFSLTLVGHNLAEVSEVQFVPSTGIVVEDAPVVNSEGTVATVKVTILMHAPLGPRLVVVRTPSGQSSLTPTEANTFKVSFAHLH
ncbi:MAG: hypothetical protein AB1411_14760 [Nitrospirota bacterium]